MWLFGIVGALRSLEERIDNNHAQIVVELRSLKRAERGYNMATRETLDKLNAGIAANTNATKAAHDALMNFAQSNADLTKALQDAIAGGDEDEIKAAADAIEANNAELISAVPATAKAITDNTPAATA